MLDIQKIVLLVIGVLIITNSKILMADDIKSPLYMIDVWQQDENQGLRIMSTDKVEVTLEKGKKVIYNNILNGEAIIDNLEINEKYEVTVKDDMNLHIGFIKLYNKNGRLYLEKNIIDATDMIEDDRSIMDEVIKYEIESNNTMKTANKIYDEKLYGKISKKGDVDYYKTMFNTVEDATFILSNVPEGKDYELYIYDDKNNLVGASCRASNLEMVQISHVEPNRWYYIKVCGYNKSYDKKNFYTLNIKKETCIENRQGHSFNKPQIITANNVYNGELLCVGDSYYYKFTASTSGEHIIKSSGEVDLYGEIYDSSKNLLSSEDDMEDDIYGNFKITQNMQEGCTYLIKIRHYADGYGKFGVVIQAPTNNLNKTQLIEDTFSGNTSVAPQYFKFVPNVTGAFKINVKGKVVSTISSQGEILSGIEEDDNYVYASTLQANQEYEIEIKAKDKVDSKFSISIEELNKPTDEYFDMQWALFNEKNGIDINIIPAWNIANNASIRIGIADTGAFYEHDELKDNINSELMYNFTHNMHDVFPENENETSSSAKAGHGTHVAGIIGAKINNDIGIAGIMPNAEIVPLKTIGSKIPEYDVYNKSIASFVKAIEYAEEHDIKIINCSFGGKTPSVAEQEAMKNAEDILFVVAAGNSGDNLEEIPWYPACYYGDNEIVVASVNEDGELSDFSCYGGPTDIAAPGESIISTYPYNDYAYKSGTSMATPVISGVCGLVWAQNLNLTPQDIKTIMTNTENVTPRDNLLGKASSGGLVNAFKAVNAIKSYDCQSIMSVQDAKEDIFGENLKRTVLEYNEAASEEEKSNEIIVKCNSEWSIENIREVLAMNSITIKDEYEYIDLIGAYVLQLEQEDNLNPALKTLNIESNIIYAEANYIRQIQ